MVNAFPQTDFVSAADSRLGERGAFVTDQISYERADIADWGAPLIADCLGLAYRACLGADEQLVGHFTQQHRRLWLSLVGNELAKAIEAQHLLGSLAKICQLTDEAIEAIDEIVLDELTDVVAQRFQGSPAKTRSYNRILIDVAAVLTRTRIATAALN